MTKSDDKRVPALRFKGFTDEWEQRKPGDFLFESKIIGHKGDKAKKLTVKLWGKGVQEKQDILSGSANTQYYIRKSGQLMYGKLDFLHAAFGIVPPQLNNYESTIDSPSFDVKSANSIFLLNLFLRKKFYLYYGERANGSRKAKRIHEKDFLVMPIKVPEINEQNKISSLIKIINNQITLQQRKLKLIKLFEKEAIKQVYNHKLKFNFDKLEWQKVMLKELAHISTGKLDANAMIKNGKYDFYTSGIKKYKTDTFKFNGPAITIAGNGATVGFMHIADGKFNAYQRTYVLFKLKCNRTFLFYEIQEKLPAKIHSESRTGNIPYIVKEMLTDLEIEIPSIFVQNNIAHYETYLKNITILNERKVDTLLKLKQFLLQNMFI